VGHPGGVVRRHEWHLRVKWGLTPLFQSGILVAEVRNVQEDVKVTVSRATRRQAKMLAANWDVTIKEALERAVSAMASGGSGPVTSETDAEASRLRAALQQAIRERDEARAELDAVKSGQVASEELARSYAEQKKLREELAQMSKWLQTEQQDRFEARDLAVEFILPKEKKRIQATKQEFFDRYEWLKAGYDAAMERF